MDSSSAISHTSSNFAPPLHSHQTTLSIEKALTIIEEGNSQKNTEGSNSLNGRMKAKANNEDFEWLMNNLDQLTEEEMIELVSKMSDDLWLAGIEKIKDKDSVGEEFNQAMANIFNALSRFATFKILETNHVTRFIFFKGLAQASFEKKDFDSAGALYCAFESTALSRLGASSIQIKFFSPDKNFMNYRNAIKGLTEDYVPFFHLLSKDAYMRSFMEGTNSKEIPIPRIHRSSNDVKFHFGDFKVRDFILSWYKEFLQNQSYKQTDQNDIKEGDILREDMYYSHLGFQIEDFFHGLSSSIVPSRRS